MSIGARNNGYGSFIFKETHYGTSGYITTKGVDHPSTSAAEIMEVHICGRGPHTNNPKHVDHGIPNYRTPAGYNRFVWDVKPKQGDGSKKGSDGTYYYQKFYPTGAMNDYCPWQLGGRSINFSNWEIDNLVNRTRVDMLNKLSDMKANLAEDLATAKQSYDLVVDSATRLVEALLFARRGNVKGAARALGLTSSRGISRDILEFQYGWRPLMSDIFGAKQLLQDALSRPPLLTAKKTRKFSTTLVPTNSGWTGESQAKFMYKVSCQATISSNWLHSVQQTGLDNPGLLAWELIPWSFVVDWVLPVGPMLQALHASAGLNFVSGWDLGVLEVQVKSHRPDGYNGYYGTQPSIEGEGFVMDRRKLETFPTFSPYVKSPFSTEHGLNLLALMTQLFKH